MSGPRQIAILVEGQTEAAFVSNVLAPYLQAHGVYAVPVIVETARLADGTTFKGGGISWKHYESHLRKLLGSTHFRCVSILIDFYAYPSSGPGAECCDGSHRSRECAKVRVQAMERAISNPRFLANIVLHEFETWVIAAAMDADQVLDDESVARALQVEAASVADDVELLNDSPQTAPSKRIMRCWPDYQKVTDGVAVIQEAGLQAVMDRCPGLKSWVERLLAC